ncbi:MAG: hypothetical protein WA393_00330 [Nitrososphaeraceae archaeon]
MSDQRRYIILVLAFLLFNTLVLSQPGTHTPYISALPAKQQTNSTTAVTTTDVPPVMLSYGGHTYEMLPFVVVDEDGVKKLNFPRLADEYKPAVKIPSDKTFTFEFTKMPREVNAFGIDYDADTTEVNPLVKIGKHQFSFGNLHGIRTLELRAIYDNGKYVTYTALVNIDKATNEIGSILDHQSNSTANKTIIPDIFSSH